MKRISLIVLALMLALSFGTTVSAEETSDIQETAITSGILGPVRKAQEVKERLEARQEMWNETRDGMRTRMHENIRERATLFVDRVQERFAAAIERLQTMHDRIEDRIALIEESRDVTLDEAKAHLDEAQGHINDALEALEAVPQVIEDATTGSTTPGMFEPVREALGVVKEHLRLAHQSLVAAIASIKLGVAPVVDADTQE